VSLHDLLGWVEAILVPLSIGWLLACLALGRRAGWAIAFAVFVGLTVAQPFGLVVSAADRDPPADAEEADPTAVRVARVLGVPALPYVLYRDDNFFIEGDTVATTSLHARSWFWLPVLTNSTEVTPMCYGSGNGAPCWVPDDPQTGRLSLAEKDGTWWASISHPDYPTETWKLSPGIASLGGLAYWAVVALLILVIRAPPSSRLRRWS
jgi:hypothetical protein